jgi:hypothetical protein
MTEPATTANLLPYLSRPMTSPSEDVQISIEQGPIAVADALPRTQLVCRRFGFPDHTIAATAMAPRPKGRLHFATHY